MPGAPLSAHDVLPGWAWLAVPLLALGAAPWRLAPLAAAGALLVLLAGLGAGAAALLDGAAPAARATLGSAAWVALAALAALVFWPGQRRLLAAALLVLGLGVLAWGGVLDGFSLAVEFRARREAVGAALATHLWLSLSALGLASALASLLALAGLASARLAAFFDALLGGVQVVPAIALFGLLVPLLAALLGAFPGLRAAGFGAIGATPALIGIALYLSLPLLRALRTGLTATDPAVIQAATALGMGRGRMLAWVRLPLGLPHFLGGLRVAAVQAVGLVTLGGLVGAGGLGALVFEGMSQFATDLILLGALPVVALALAVDAGLGAMERRA
nr:ABC transporter permease subunit [Roseococcus suduntuyensis]